MKGVAMTPPPPGLLASMERQVTLLVNDLPADKRGAIVTVVTTAGVNLAVVAKLNDTWAIQGWVGKTWSGPVEGAGEIRASW